MQVDVHPYPGPVKSPGPSSQVSKDPEIQKPSPQVEHRSDEISEPPPQYQFGSIERQSEVHPAPGPVKSPSPSSHTSRVPVIQNPSPHVEHLSTEISLPPEQYQPASIDKQSDEQPAPSPVISPGPSSHYSNVPEILKLSPHVEQTSS